MKLNLFNMVHYSHFLMTSFLKEDSIVVDATCGNGHDSLFLCKTMKGKGFLYSFDIQAEAIEHTQRLLSHECKYSNYKLIHDCHSQINTYIKAPIDFAVYNLGYLPNSLSTLSTQGDTTLESLSKTVSQLALKGYVLIVAYLGHDNSKERDLIKEYLQNLDQKYYKAVHHKMINMNNYPPEVFILQKVHDANF